MATIQFDNGTRVQFDGTPSSADVDEVAKNLGIGGGPASAPPGPPEDILTKSSNVMNSIFPNKNIGELGGSLLAPAAAYLAGGAKAVKYADMTPHTTVGGVAGDVTGDALNLGSLLLAPETGGTSLLARSGVNAGIGGGISLANSASQGQSLTDPEVLKNAAGAATLSSVFPFIGSGARSFMNAAKEASGVTPQIQTALKTATEKELQDYIDTTVAHNKDLNTPTATGAVAEKLNQASDVITQRLKEAGGAVGEAVKKTGATPIGMNPVTKTPFTDEILSSFNRKLEDTFGHEIRYSPSGNTSLRIGGTTMHEFPAGDPELAALDGRSRTISSADKTRILTMHNQIMDLAQNPTVAKGSDVVHNLDDLIDYSKVDQVGINHDPLQGIIRSTRGEINGAIRSASPEIAAANDRFSQLKAIDNEIGEKAGHDLQRSALVMRRVFSGDQSGKSLQLLNDIKRETGIDLIKHSALAKFATDTFGNEASKSLLQQEINQGGSMVGGMRRAILAPLKDVAKRLVIPEPGTYAKKITQGKKYANTLDELLSSHAGHAILRTYFNNISAAHSEGGKTIDRSAANLLGNLTGH